MEIHVSYVALAWTCVGVLAALLFAAWQHFRLPPTSAPTLPGVHCHPLLGHSQELVQAVQSGEAVSLFDRWLREAGGKIVAARCPGMLFVIYSDPDALRAVNAKHESFIMHELVQDAFASYARGVIALQGELWHSRRRALTHAFAPTHMRIVMTAADAVISDWLAGMSALAAETGSREVSFECDEVFMTLFLDVMMRAMLGTSAHTHTGPGGATPDGAPKTGADVLLYNARAARAGLPRHEQQLLNDVNTVMASVMALSLVPKLLWGVSTTAAFRDSFTQASKRIRTHAESIMRERIAARRKSSSVKPSESEAPSDFLDILLDACECACEGACKCEGKLDEAGVVDEIMIMLLAATETSAHTMTWLVYNTLRDAHDAPMAADYLDQFETGDSPSATFRKRPLGPSKLWERAWAEVSRSVGARVCSPLTWDALEALPFTEGWLKEVLRLLNTAPGTARRALQPVTIHGVAIPAGSIIECNNTVMHTDADIFGRPLATLPERWAADAPADIRPRKFGAMNAFGGGPRMCMGHKFAMVQMKAFAARLLQAFAALRFAPHAPPVSPIQTITTRARHGVHVVATLREQM